MKILQQTVNSQLINEFKRKIIKEEWEPGMRIPTENELAMYHSVSRCSVREALQNLTAIGLLRREKKEIYVSDNVSSLLSEPLELLIGIQKIGSDELFETSLVLEIAMAGMAARRRGEEDVQTLQRIVTEMRQSKTYRAFYKKHIEFRTAAAKSSKNQMLISLFEGILDSLLDEQQTGDIRGMISKQALDDHQEILDAITNKDSKMARLKMSSLLKKRY